jgi:hypothetical protein
MPTRPRSPCAESHCPGFAQPGSARCALHTKAREKAYDLNRGEDHKFYSLPRWRRFRAWFLLRHPVCEEDSEPCVEMLHLEVDHILGRHEHPELAFVESNCRALCKSHHAARTAREQGWNRKWGGGGVRSLGGLDN